MTERQTHSRLSWAIASIPILLVLALVAWDSSPRRNRGRQAADDKSARSRLATALEELISCANAVAPTEPGRNLLQRLWSERFFRQQAGQKLRACLERFDRVAAPMFAAGKRHADARMREARTHVRDLYIAKEVLKKFATSGSLIEPCGNIEALRRLFLSRRSNIAPIDCHPRPIEAHWVSLPRPIWSERMRVDLLHPRTRRTGHFEDHVSFAEVQPGGHTRIWHRLVVRTLDGAIWEALPFWDYQRSDLHWGERDVVAVLPTDGETIYGAGAFSATRSLDPACSTYACQREGEEEDGPQARCGSTTRARGSS